MSYLLEKFDKVISINLRKYFEALYHLIYNRFDCNLDNSHNIQKLEEESLYIMNINSSDLLYKTIKELIHFEIRLAIPIKDINSYKEKELICALNKCIRRYLTHDQSLIVYIRPAFDKQFASKLIYTF